MSTSTLTSKGQTTIPKDVRKRLDLHPGIAWSLSLMRTGECSCCRRVSMVPQDGFPAIAAKDTITICERNRLQK